MTIEEFFESESEKNKGGPNKMTRADFVDAEGYYHFLWVLSEDKKIKEVDGLLRYWVSIEAWDFYLFTKLFWAEYTNNIYL